MYNCFCFNFCLENAAGLILYDSSGSGSSIDTVDIGKQVSIIDDIDFDNFSTSFDIKENDIFLSKEYMIKVMQLYAITHHFEYKVLRSSSTRFNLICCAPSCPWMMNAVSSKNCHFWTVRKYTSLHSMDHRMEVFSNRHVQATSSLVSQCIKTELLNRSASHVTPKDVISTMLVKGKVEISYYKAWKSRQLALKEIRGCPEESYSLLPLVAKMMKERNPGKHLTSFRLSKLINLLFFIS